MEFLYSKTHMLASVSITGTFLSYWLSNPVGFIAGSIAIIAGLVNLTIVSHKAYLEFFKRRKK